MIQIKSAVLHVFDFAHDHLELSEQVMPDEDLRQLIFARKQCEGLMVSPILKSGEFDPQSVRKVDFERYAHEELSLLDLSTKIAEEWYRLIKLSDKIEPATLLALDVYDNEKHLVVFLKYKNQNKFMYAEKSKDGKNYAGIVENMAVLPTTSTAIDECFYVNLDTLKIRYKDNKRVIEEAETLVIADRLLFCTKNLSQKEIIKTINSATKDMCDTYEIDPLAKVAKTKKYVQEKLTEDGYLRLNEMAEEVFAENKAMQLEYIQNLQDYEVPSDTFLNTTFAQSATKNIKLKTDTGVEVTLPSLYFEDPEHFEIIQNEDMTFTIQIKNVLYVK